MHPRQYLTISTAILHIAYGPEPQARRLTRPDGARQQGKYKPTLGTSPCHACPPRATTAQNGSVADSDCACNAGYYNIAVPSAPAGQLCLPCPRDSYKPGPSRATCIPCPPRTAAPPASPAAESCACVAGSFPPSPEGGRGPGALGASSSRRRRRKHGPTPPLLTATPHTHARTHALTRARTHARVRVYMAPGPGLNPRPLGGP